MKWEKVLFNKADMDTVLTGFLCKVSEDMSLSCVYRATDDELWNPEILCIEVGGTGLTHLHNFDHHNPEKYFPPACKQAYEYFGYNDPILETIVKYVSMVDDGIVVNVEPPSLSNIFSGMLLTITEPVDQFITGLYIFKWIYENRINPFQSLPDVQKWKSFYEARLKNFLQLKQDSRNIISFKTRSGYQCRVLVTTAVGGFNFLYGTGCEIGILYNPEKGKYTIGSDKLDLTELLKKFQSIEDGWGGRNKIFGSPYNGSKLSMDEIIEIVKSI